MNRGVSLLLKRMESNPEEFPLRFGTSLSNTWNPLGPWNSFVDVILEGSLDLGFMSEEEHRALLEKYWSIQGDNFTEAVVRVITRDPEEDKVPF